jgi:hypothetical protein
MGPIYWQIINTVAYLPHEKIRIDFRPFAWLAGILYSK